MGEATTAAPGAATAPSAPEPGVGQGGETALSQPDPRSIGLSRDRALPMKIDAFHMPALHAIETTSVDYGPPSARVELRYATMGPELLSTQIEALRSSRTSHLANRPVREIAAVVGRVAERFLDPPDSLRERALGGLEAVSGLSPRMAVRVLERMAIDWTEAALLALLTAEFGEPDVLDRFAARPGVGARRRAFGPALAFHVFSGNVPGVSVTSLIRALLVKSASLAKSASGEPVLAPLFAAALAEEDPGIGDCIAVTYWPGGDPALESAAMDEADVVIAYGGSRAIESLRHRVPAAVPFVSYAHRVSFGVLGREALGGGEATRNVEAAALAVATFDQQGCVSPHLFYVEEGGAISAREWAERLAAALGRLAVELPRGRISGSEASEIQQLRGEARFAQLAGTGVELHESPTGTDWSVIYDPDSTFSPSCLNRVVRVKPVDDLLCVVDQVKGLAGVLQTVAIAAPRGRTAQLASALATMGASRITSLERMPWPSAEWHHDGQPPLLRLVRWCDWE